MARLGGYLKTLLYDISATDRWTYAARWCRQIVFAPMRAACIPARRSPAVALDDS